MNSCSGMGQDRVRISDFTQALFIYFHILAIFEKITHVGYYFVLKKNDETSTLVFEIVIPSR